MPPQYKPEAHGGIITLGNAVSSGRRSACQVQDFRLEVGVEPDPLHCSACGSCDVEKGIARRTVHIMPVGHCVWRLNCLRRFFEGWILHVYGLSWQFNGPDFPASMC